MTDDCAHDTVHDRLEAIESRLTSVESEKATLTERVQALEARTDGGADEQADEPERYADQNRECLTTYEELAQLKEDVQKRLVALEARVQALEDQHADDDT